MSPQQSKNETLPYTEDHQHVEDASDGPTHDEISRLAHSYWLEREPGHGSAEEDWLQAERDLREQTDSKTR